MKIWKNIRENYQNEVILFGIFVGLFAVMSIISPDKFLSAGNLQTMCYQMPEFGLMALAMMAAVLTGGMNLSICTGATVSSIAAGCFMATAFANEHPAAGVLAGIILTVAVAAVTGLLNGVLVAYVGVAAMLVTLGTKLLFEGLGLVVTKGGSLAGFPALFLKVGSGALFGIPYTILIYIAAIVVSYFLFERSVWGTQVYMIGCNETATRFSGIATRRTLLLVYVYSGIMYGLSGVLISSRYCSAKTDYGSSYLMQAVTAVVLGGTSISGGSGTVAGTVIAVAIIQVVSNGLNLVDVNRYMINMITGMILIAVLVVRYVSGALNDRKKIRQRAGA